MPSLWGTTLQQRLHIISVAIPADQLAIVKQVAREREQSVSGFMRFAARQEIERAERDARIAEDNAR